MNTYDVTVSRKGDLWVADIAGMAAATNVLRFGDLDVEVLSAAKLFQHVIADVLGLSHQRVHQLANTS
ncbi:MAG: hypothetical protein ACRDTA_15810 [Pseudonocardiaceae bacterium]